MPGKIIQVNLKTSCSSLPLMDGRKRGIGRSCHPGTFLGDPPYNPCKFLKRDLARFHR